MSKHRGKEQNLIFRHLTICISRQSARLCVLVPAAGPEASLTAESHSLDAFRKPAGNEWGFSWPLWCNWGPEKSFSVPRETREPRPVICTWQTPTSISTEFHKPSGAQKNYGVSPFSQGLRRKRGPCFLCHQIPTLIGKFRHFSSPLLFLERKNK